VKIENAKPIDHIFDCRHDPRHAEAVGVCLHHRMNRHADAAANVGGVLSHALRVNLD